MSWRRRFGLIDPLLIGFAVLALFSKVLPNPVMQEPRLPWSLFIDQVHADKVRRTDIASDQIHDARIKPTAGVRRRCWRPRRSSTGVCRSGSTSTALRSPPPPAQLAAQPGAAACAAGSGSAMVRGLWRSIGSVCGGRLQRLQRRDQRIQKRNSDQGECRVIAQVWIRAPEPSEG